MRRRIVVGLIVALLFAILVLLFKWLQKNDANIDNFVAKNQITIDKNISEDTNKGEDNEIEDIEENEIKSEENETKNEDNKDTNKDEISNKEPNNNIEQKDKDEVVHFSASVERKLGHIISVNKNQIVFDEIDILPSSDCEGMEICFVNNSKIFNKFPISRNVEIDSYFVNYLTNGNLKQSKKIGLNCFIEFFESDDYTNYTWFDKIPYWISLQNGEVTKIEEQQIKSQYMLNDDFYENKDL